jgi:hypothetical protein
MTVFASQNNARTFNFQAGDVGAVPFPMGHYIENIGATTLRFLEIFRSDHFADVWPRALHAERARADGCRADPGASMSDEEGQALQRSAETLKAAVARIQGGGVRA